MPQFLSIGVGAGWNRRQSPDELGKQQAGYHHDGKDYDFRFNDATDTGAGQLDFTKLYSRFTVVMYRNRSIPDLNSLITEILGAGNKTGLPHERQAHELTGNTFHTCGDVGNERGINKSIQ